MQRREQKPSFEELLERIRREHKPPRDPAFIIIVVLLILALIRLLIG